MAASLVEWVPLAAEACLVAEAAKAAREEQAVTMAMVGGSEAAVEAVLGHSARPRLPRA